MSKAAQRAKARNNAIMTGVLITRYKMGLISEKDLEQMVLDESKPERSQPQKECWMN